MDLSNTFPVTFYQTLADGIGNNKFKIQIMKQLVTLGIMPKHAAVIRRFFSI